MPVGRRRGPVPQQQAQGLNLTAIFSRAVWSSLSTAGIAVRFWCHGWHHIFEVDARSSSPRPKAFSQMGGSSLESRDRPAEKHTQDRNSRLRTICFSGASTSPAFNVLVRDPRTHVAFVEFARGDGEDGFLVNFENPHQFLAAYVGHFRQTPQSLT
jgi:hypothetical protein